MASLNSAALAVPGHDRISRERIAAGTWRHDSGPLRVHIRSLQAAGMGTPRIAALAGVNRKTLQNILVGRPDRGSPPPETVRYDVGEAILAVQLDLAPHATVEASGTVRRVHALCTIGWTLSDVADAAGWRLTRLCGMVGRGSVPYAATVLARTAAQFATLYDAESMNPREGLRADAARSRARERCWFSPLAWDDDTIDDPDALPQVLPPADGEDRHPGELIIQHIAAGHPVERSRNLLEEMVRRLEGGGYTNREIAAICGTTEATVSAAKTVIRNRQKGQGHDELAGVRS